MSVNFVLTFGAEVVAGPVVGLTDEFEGKGFWVAEGVDVSLGDPSCNTKYSICRLFSSMLKRELFKLTRSFDAILKTI